MNDPGVLLTKTLDGFIAHFKLIPGFELPRQCFTHVGQVSADYELLAVTIPPNGIYQGQPGFGRPGFVNETGGIVMWSMDISVVLTRGMPGIDNAGGSPTGELLTAASRLVTSDVKALLDTYNALMNDPEFLDPCVLHAFSSVTFDGPQGGMLSTMLNWSISL